MHQHKYFALITGLFCSCLVISNILDTKFFEIFGIVFPAGIIIFPIVYVFGDIFTEVYGYRYSRRAIWAGFFSLVILVSTLQIAKSMEPASFWIHQEAFEIILGKVYRIALASIIAYLSGEFLNSFTLAKLKIKQDGKSMPIRFVSSTIIGQLVDTGIFVSIAFIGTMEINNLLKVFIYAWIFKVLWEIIALPISIPLVKYLKRIENEDFFDKDTNFNPFKIN